MIYSNKEISSIHALAACLLKSTNYSKTLEDFLAGYYGDTRHLGPVWDAVARKPSNFEELINNLSNYYFIQQHFKKVQSAHVDRSAREPMVTGDPMSTDTELLKSSILTKLLIKACSALDKEELLNQEDYPELTAWWVAYSNATKRKLDEELRKYTQEYEAAQLRLKAVQQMIDVAKAEREKFTNE